MAKPKIEGLDENLKPEKPAKPAGLTERILAGEVKDTASHKETKQALRLKSVRIRGDVIPREEHAIEFLGHAEFPGTFTRKGEKNENIGTVYERVNLILPKTLLDRLDTSMGANKKRTAAIAGLIQYALDNLDKNSETLEIGIDFKA